MHWGVVGPYWVIPIEPAFLFVLSSSWIVLLGGDVAETYTQSLVYLDIIVNEKTGTETKVIYKASVL